MNSCFGMEAAVVIIRRAKRGEVREYLRRTGMKWRRIAVILTVWMILGGIKMQADADYRIFVASDPHYIAASLTDGGEYYQKVLDSGDSKFMPYSEEIMDAFLAEVLKAQPDALLLTGDLTFNGAVISHEALTEELRTVESGGVPVLVLTGNHDVYNINAARYHGTEFTRVPFATTELFSELYAGFGLNEALSADTDSLSYIYPLNASTRILMLDFNTLHDYCGVSETTLGWIEQQLREAEEAGAEVLAAGHQNLFQHTVFYDGYVIERTERLSNLLEKYGVSLFLSGHLHVQHIRKENGLTEIASSALCSYPCQYGILENTGGTFSYETRRLDMKTWAEANGRKEPVFQHFPEAAADYMTAHFRAAPASVADSAERDAMTAYLQQLNLAYFAGDLRNVRMLDPDGSMAQRWMEEKDLTALYVSSVLKETGKDFTHWKSE